MEPLTQLARGLRGLVLLLTLSGTLAAAQAPLFCVPSAVNTLVRVEGLTERIGDIQLHCSQGPAGSVITGNLTVFLNVNVTNRITAEHITDATVNVDTGSGPVTAAAPGQLLTPTAVAFNGLSFTVPASGKVDIGITNLRVDANQLGLGGQQIVSATVSFSVAQSNNSLVTAAITQRGLLATAAGGTVRCTGSPLPATISFTNFFAAGTRFVSTRVTEGFVGAFQKKDASSDTGTRIMVRYSGFPTGVHLFLPDAVAGSSAIQPTAAGDLGLARSGGQYAGSVVGSLLLVRVLNVNPDGSGGTPAYTYPGLGTVTFDAASEVPLANGQGIAIYEVVDSNPNVQESAQFPTFLGIAPAVVQANAVASIDVSLAPVSTIAVATPAPAPVPRFVQVEPPSDCAALGDCSAPYFPELSVDAPPLDYAAPFGAFLQTKYVRVHNLAAGSQMNWTATIDFADAPPVPWLTLFPASGTNDATVRIDAHPDLVPPGTYTATVTIDAGPLAGSRSLPVTFTVGSPFPNVTGVGNSAVFAQTTLVPGSLGTITGQNLSGPVVFVTFDGQPATLLAVSGTQIILRVPESLAGKTSAQLVVAVDGVSSTPRTVALTTVAPGIFGIVNQDNTVNSAARPAPVGTILQIFATGLMSPSSGAISASIAGRHFDMLYYGGPAPTLPGMQQVNLFVPEDLPAGTTPVTVCAATPAADQPVCSPAFPVILTR